jgi:hypothetical protein
MYSTFGLKYDYAPLDASASDYRTNLKDSKSEKCKLESRFIEFTRGNNP